MANTAQARKRARQNERHRQRNASQRSRMRTSIKKVLSAVSQGSYDAATAAFRVAQPLIDRMVTKGLVHKNAAARWKSRLNSKVKAIK